MAGWLDYLDQERASGGIGSQKGYRPPSLRLGTTSGQGQYDPWEVSRPTAAPWTSRTPGVVQRPPAAPYEAPSFPERVDVSMPFSTPVIPGAPAAPAPPAAPADTTGDLLGSIGQALGASVASVNLATAIPWVMERVNALAINMAESDIAPVAALGEAIKVPTGAFVDGITAASDAVAPILEALPNWYRDTQLADRAKLYKAIVTGQTLDTGPLGMGISGTILPGTYAVSEKNRQLEWWRGILLSSADPNEKLDAERRIAMLRDAVDLPESVKGALRVNPNMDDEAIKKLLDEAPEGRQWSYDPGISGMIANFGYPVGFFLVEAKAGMGLARGAQVALRGSEGIIPALQAVGATRAAAGLSRAVGAVERGVTVAAKIQKYAMISGASVAGLTTALDAIARYNGDEAAIAWFDKVNRTAPMSDNPRVQLVTGFTVNPFEALGALKRGVVTIGKGGNIVLGRTLGSKFAKFYESDDLVYGLVAKMYRLGGASEAKVFADQFYDSKGEVYDEVVGLAADQVLDRLPHEERLSFLAAHNAADDPTALTKAVLQTYGDDVYDTLTKHGDELAQRWYQHSWEYHQYPGGFSPEVAALNARDFRLAKARTLDLRQRVDAVVGYAEYLRPEGQMLAREWLERVATDGRVSLAGRDGLQDLVRQFPALRKYWQGLVRAGDTHVSSDTVNEILRRAEADYASAAKQNPIRVRTGADPVLRPDSPRGDLDYAEALGTDVPTVQALSEWKGTADQVDSLRNLLTGKGVVEPEIAAAMTPEEVFVRASDYVDTTTKPWREAGERIVAAEKQVAALRGELQRLHAIDPGRRSPIHQEAIRETEQRLARMMTLIREASDPIVPFSEDIRIDRLRARNADRVKQMDPARLSATDESFLRRYVFEDGQYAIADRLEPRELWEHAKAIADKAPVGVSRRDAHLAELAMRKVEAQEKLRMLSEIDAGTTALGFDGTPGWANMVRQVEGRWTWSGGKPPMSRGMRNALSRYFGERPGKGQLSRDMMTMGDEDAWGVLRDNPDALEALTRTQRNAVSRLLADHALYATTLDEAADTAVRAGEVTSTQEFLERITDLAEHRAQLLADSPGGSLAERNLSRTAALDVPPEYVAEAEANLASRSLVYDPEFDSIIHPRNIAEVQRILDSPELYPALRNAVLGDPVLEAAAARIAGEKGIALTDLLSDPATHNGALRSLIPAGFEAPIPGIHPETWLDDLVMADDAAAIAQRSAEIASVADGPRPPIQTTLASARRARPVHPSTEWRRRMVDAGADLTAAPAEAILADPANRIGLDVLSLLNHGVVGTKPATIRGTISLLREIENGGATRMGIGPSLQAEGQRVADLILREGVKGARREGIGVGVFGRGLDPALMAGEDLELARAIAGVLDETTGGIRRGLDGDVVRSADSQAANVRAGVLRGGTPESGGAVRAAGAADTSRRIDLSGIRLSYDAADPLGTLQYGLKKRPKAAVVMELAQVPGLAEEFVSGRFLPWSERVWTGWTRQLYNYVFGPLENGAVGGAVRQEFVDRAVRQGIDGGLADAIWQGWRKAARESRDVEIRVGPKGVRSHLPADNPLYADVRNIPNRRMDKIAHEAADEYLDGLQRKGLLDPAYRTLAHTIDYATTFREASSPVRRWLNGEGVKIGQVNVPSAVPQQLGKALGNAYGLAAHNSVVTTLYYWFRFALDIRYHAMNYFEAQILYAGRAGLRRGEIDTGMLGQTEGYLRRFDIDFADNTGYATSRSRFAWAYRTFLKEQPDALRGKVKGLAADDPELMQQAVRELADADPQLAGMIRDMGDTPDGWVKAVDAWHSKMLKTATETDADMVIDEAIAAEIRKTPAMAEVYSALSLANKDLWRNIRSTFYGNPSRSRVERFLNSYLLFWPLSYQIKAAKWLTRLMFDRVGGVQTNAGGAVMLDRMAQTHQQLLATDPEYRDWFEKHDTLVFAAQMFLPITPSSMGVSLNPILRSMFFERSKAAWEVGPVYTFNRVLKPGMGEIVDLYPELRDVPGFDGVYRTLTGRDVPEPAPPAGY